MSTNTISIFKICYTSQLWTLHAKMALANSQQYPLKFCFIKYDLDINVFNFENWLFSTVLSLQK